MLAVVALALRVVDWTPPTAAAPLSLSFQADLGMTFSAPLMVRVDAGDPTVMLAGVHVGCDEVVGTNRVRALRDLKGTTVAVPELGSAHHLFLSSMVAYVGLDPRKDVQWVTHSPSVSIQLLAEGKVDAIDPIAR